MKARERDELGVLRKLREVAAQLARETDPAALVPKILESAIELVGAERGFIILMSPGAPAAGSAAVAAARNIDREAIQEPQFKFSRSVVQQVATSGRGVCVSDAEADERTRDVPSVRELELRSILCVPLLVLGRSLGVVYVDHRYLKARFDEKDLATLEAFAVPAAVILDAAQRTAELAASRNEALQRLQTIERLRAELAERFRRRTRDLDRVTSESARRAALPSSEDELPGVVARSAAMKRVLGVLRKVARSEASVLIVGESGSGKEVIARALHALSTRAKGPFVAENCAALADTLLESELFGHEPGAFTGAVKSHAGLFETARGGTLLLDEIGEMSPSLQAKLLRVLEEREVRRVGGEARIPVDVRLVGATHRDLEAMIAQGTFRQDLYYRLKVVRIDVPPLRERPEDVVALLDRFLSPEGEPKTAVDPQARELLLAYPWPGNVRELANECHRLRVLAGPGGVVRPPLLSEAILARAGVGPQPARAPLDPAAAPDERPIEGLMPLAEVEKEMVRRALPRASGNKTLAAQRLGIPKTSLYHMLERYQL
jgi:transcriptional regulator with GAF, ATPase, and Fis domain